MSGPYEDIINLPHPVSKIYNPMPMEKRAAQFSPFAALTGYEDGIKETARLTDHQISLDEDDIASINMKLIRLRDVIAENPVVNVTHFKKDEKKEGGKYVSSIDTLLKIDEYEKTIMLMGGKKIAIKDIIDIQSKCFDVLEKDSE